MNHEESKQSIFIKRIGHLSAMQDLSWIGESKRNTATRWGELNKPQFCLAKPSKQFFKYVNMGKNVKVKCIALLSPTLNDELKENKLLLVGNPNIFLLIGIIIAAIYLSRILSIERKILL